MLEDVAVKVHVLKCLFERFRLLSLVAGQARLERQSRSSSASLYSTFVDCDCP